MGEDVRISFVIREDQLARIRGCTILRPDDETLALPGPDRNVHSRLAAFYRLNRDPIMSKG